ncbi:hypothetical protein PRZ48_011844 [Zasmidium cellare]|uniref:C-CAP/cofactor C-like domain-containing protein n=1 Tax=Zasmidium cellare TaxID=395010 RepID=A0ABR0E801_ZASCE|nr:hypothetical protein PRZ48_011844 [Zasmidium cellare]
MATAATDGSAQPTASEKFFRYFQHEVTDLQDQMSRIENTASSGGERADAVDHCLSAIARLSNEVQDASSYIPAYDQRTYGDAIKALNTKLQDVRAVHAPRQKFSFKNKSLFSAQKNPSAISLNDAAEMADQKRKQIPGHLSDVSNDTSYVNTPASNLTPSREKDQEEAEKQDSGNETTQASTESSTNTLSPNTARTIRQPSFSQSSSVTISDHDNIHIILPTAASHATTSGTVSNLSHSIIDLSPPTTSTNGQPFATLTLKNISHSLIICGHVSGAAHLTNIKNSVIVVASRQFRMHDSSNCDVYLLATSRPIIEDCYEIRFAPLPQAYMTERDQDVENKWSNVDDFKWLRNEPSPHWRALEADERVGESVWKEVVPGGPELGVEEILKAVGVKG